MFPHTIAKLTQLYGMFLAELPTMTEATFDLLVALEGYTWEHRDDIEAMAAEEDAEQEAYTRILTESGWRP